MVAIVSGNSLGLNLSSLATLGQRGTIGNASTGRNGEQAFVNIATGNLVLRDNDDGLVGVGGAVNVLRTYNSQGTFNDDNGDNWLNGLDRKIEVIGTPMAAGSVIKRTDRDGAVATYEFDAEAGLYVATAGAGAHDTIAFDPAQNRYVWTDGSSRQTETYDAGDGRLLQSTDGHGNTLTYGWSQSGIESITNSNGEALWLEYGSSRNLSRVRAMTLENGSYKYLHTVSYTYDTSNRLESVTVDLSPEDGTISDGYVYKTIYQYDGASTRIASVTQSDGTRLAFTYVQIGSEYRVATVTNALGETTSYSYDPANLRTTVVDPLGQPTVYEYDAAGQLTRIDAPGAAGTTATTRFTYNASGDLVRVEDAEGRAIVMEYDERGNQVLQRDAMGNTLARVFDAQNRIVAETVYLVPDPDGDGDGQPSAPQTTRYAYDAGNQNLLRFTISAAGRVTEHRYDAAGNLVRSVKYAGDMYPVAALTELTAPAESEMAAWAAAQNAGRVEVVDMSYDFRGQLQATTQYAEVDAYGVGAAASATTTRYVYDQAGRLLKTISAAGGVTQYGYDGLGRVVAVSDALNQLTLTQYDDAGNKTVSRAANGLVTTSLFDRAGRLSAVVQADPNTQVLGRTSYSYDAGGRLRMTEGPTGQRTWSFYDEAGRKSADVDADGTLTEYRYNEAGQPTLTVVYSARVQVSHLVDANGAFRDVPLANVRPVASALDSRSWRVYDDAGRLTKSIDATGAVTETRYDGASNAVAVIRYANRLDTASLGDQPSSAVATPPSSPQDRVVRNFYSAEGQLRGTLDAEGYLSVVSYDAAGRVSTRVQFATATDPALRFNGTLQQLRPVASDADRQTVYLYNARGQLVAEVDPEGYLTEKVYDAAGNLSMSSRYASKVQGTVSPDAAVAALRPAAHPADRTVTWTYDALNRLISETNAEGTVSTYTYDSAGNRTSTSVAAGTGEVRTVNARFDIQGRLIAELSAEGAAKLTGDQTQAEIDAVWALYAITYTYDAAGRRTSSTDAVGNRTLYFYDDDSRLTHTVNAAGEVTEQQYNALGQLTASIRYGKRIDLSGLTGANAGGIANASLLSAIDAVRNAAADARITYTYTAAGQVASTTDATGNLTTIEYDAFGQEVSRTTALGDGRTVMQETGYDKRGLAVVSLLDPSGLRLTTSTIYDAFGRAVRSFDRNGNVSEVTYDRLGRTVATRDPLGGTRATTYDAFDRVLTQSDALGNVTSYAYSDAQRTVTVTLPGNIVTTTTRNRFGQTVKVSDANGSDTLYQYDRNGNLIQTNTALTETVSVYDRANRLLEATDANGHTIAYSYDAAGRVLTQTVDPDGLKLTTTYTYDARGNRISVRDAGGTVTTYQYDAKGQVLRQAVDGAGLNLRTTYAYDAAGRVLTVTSPAGVVTTYSYDKAGRRVSEQVDPAGLNLTRRYEYDANGNVVRSIDANGNATRFVYDANDRLVFKVEPNGALTQSVYDAEGRVIRTTTYATAISLTGLPATVTVADIAARIVDVPARDVTESRVYDANGRLRLTVDGTGAVVAYRHDANGNVVERVAYANRIAVGAWDGLSAPAVIPDAARDQRVRTVYDGINRPIYAIDGIGVVTETRYDGAGNVTERITYARPVAPGTAATAPALAAAVAQVANLAKDAYVRTEYDAANRPTWSVDGTGAVTRRIYDAAGNVARIVRYATPLARGAAFSSVVPSAADVVTAFAYDAAGRQIFQVDALGGVTEQGYDAVGNVTVRTRYATALTGTALTAILANPSLGGIRAAVQANAGLDRVERYGYDNAGRAVIAIDAQGTAVETQYDAAGNAVVVRTYAKAVDTAGLTASTTLQTLRARLTIDSANDRVVYRAYDAGSRLVYTVDALGYVKQTTYDGTGAIVRTTAYALAIPATAATTAGGIAAAVVAVAASDQTNTFVYDAAGRLIASTDPLGYSEVYTYNGLGQKLTFTNKKGSVWSYDYDAAGRLLQETAPPVELSTVAPTGPNGSLQLVSTVSAAVITRFQYDGLGNLTARTEAAGLPEERTTRYEYDALGRQIKTIHPPVPVYSEAMSDVAGNGMAGNATRVETMRSLVTQTFYDTLGNAVASKDVADAVSTKAYDQLGRVLYEVDAEGYVTGYTRNAFGEVTRMVRYAARTGLASAAIASAAQAPSRSAVEAAINAPGVDHSLDRAILTSYDRAGRVVEVIEPQAFSYDSSAAANAQYFSAGKTTRKTYNAFGDVVQVSQLRNAVTNAWTTTTNYYDRQGQQTASIDALGYLTTKSYDALGNVVVQTESANAIAAGKWSVSGYSNPAVSADDRTTLFAFDGANRMVSETRVNVEFSDTQNGASARGNLVTSYGYDAVGNRTRVTDAANASTYSYYDALGRVTAVAAPTRAGEGGASLTPLTLYRRDAYGNVVVQIDMARGAAAANEAAFTPAAWDGADRATYSKYDAHGHAVQTTDANGASRFSSYNERGQIAKTWQSVTGNDGVSRTAFQVFQYDKLGQLTHTLDPASTSVLQGGLTVSWSSATRNTDESGRITLNGTNQVNLAWSSLVNTAGGLVRVQIDYITVDTRYQSGTTEAGEPIFGGVASHAASRTVDFAAAQVGSGASIAWNDSHTQDGGLSQLSYIRVQQFENGQWVSKWEGSPAQANGSGITTITQAQAGMTDTALEYNAFGEVVRKGVNGGRQEYFDYDNAGQLWRTNSGDGVDRITLHDLNGNVTADIRSAGSGRDNLDIRSVGSADAARWLTNARRTDTQYDALGRKVSESGAERLELQGGVTVRQLAIGSSIASSAMPVTDESAGMRWSGTNEIRLSWSSLAALGSGAVKVEIEYQTKPYSYGGTFTGYDENGNPTYATDENGNIIGLVNRPGVARSSSQILTAEQGASGAVFAWQDPAMGMDGGVSKVTRVRVYKQDVNGNWIAISDQATVGGAGNAIEVAAPADPTTRVTLQLRRVGSTGDSGWFDTPLTSFGETLRYDARSLDRGNYEYRVLTTGRDQTTRITGTGTLSLEAPPLATIASALTYGAAGAGVLTWQSPGDNVEQVVRYRVWGSTGEWSTMVATSRGNGLYGVDTSVLPAAKYEFELLWVRSGEGAPYAHAVGQFVKVPEVPGYWVPQVNYPPVSVSLTDGVVGGTVTGYDESGAPIYATDENGNIVGLTPAKVLQWPAPGLGQSAVFQYRVAGTGAWATLPIWTYGAGVDESGNGAVQRVNIGALPPGNYEYQVLVTAANGSRAAQATGKLTVNAQGPGHYETRNVQVQVPVTVYPPDPSRYITGYTRASYGWPVVVGTDESGNPILGAHYAWQGSYVVGVPYAENQLLRWEEQWYTVQVPVRGEPIITGYDEAGQPIYARDENGNIAYTTVWVTEWRSQWVPIYGWVTVYPPNPGNYMTAQPKPIYGSPVVVGYDESGAPILGAHYAWQGNVVVGVPYTQYQTQTQQQQVWVEGTTPPPTMQSTTPPYTPAYYVNAIPVQYGVAVATPNNSGSTSLDPSAAGGVLGQVAQINGDARWVRPVVVQKLDRWGNVVEITDPRSPNWKTTYRYNANNQIIEERKPDADGFQSAAGPVTRITYDRLGRQASIVDANGNVNGTAYDQAGNIVTEIHADGGVVRYQYNAFGEKVVSIDALGAATRYTYDRVSRLLAVERASVEVTTVNGANQVSSLGWHRLVERYSYDQAGHKLTQTNGAGETIRYSYDLRGNVVSVTQPLGQTTRSGFDALGRKVVEVDPTNMAATWTYDYFGKVLSHSDIGGARYTYTYDNARQLISQTNTRGQSISYSYDAAGQMTGIRDNALDQTTTYAYDLAGNRVREKTVQAGVVYQNNFLAYDALNRLRDIADGDVHITIDYDKVGNRTHIGTHVLNGDTSRDSDRWFQYDSMNRQVVVDAVDQSGNLGTQGHRLTYDLNGNRISDQYWGNQVVTSGGQQVIIGYDESGNAMYSSTPVTYVRQQGWTTETYAYDGQDRLVSVVRDGVQIDHRYYDGAGRVTQSGTAGNLPQGYAQKLNEGVAQGQTNGLETRINRYDANGRLLHQRVLKSDGAAKHDIDYTSYDAAGNVLQYVLQDHEGGYTNTYNYDLVRFEGYKEGTISGTSSKFNPGSTTSQYDVNGNLKSIVDATKAENNRTFVNDASGKVLEVNQGGNVTRQLIVNGEVLGQHGMGIDPVNPRNGQGNPNFTDVANFEFGYQSIVSNYPNASPGSYTVQGGDTLQSIARSAYGDSGLWYRIAEANGLSSDRDLRVGQTLNIPNKVGGVHNDSQTFKPYDPSKVVGDTTPNLPMPSDGGGGCGVVGAIVMVVVAVVVTVFTAGAAAAAMGAAAQGFAGVMAAGGAVMTGGAVAGSTALGAVVAAGSAIVGSVASQLVGMAIGAQDGFSWKQVAMSGISAGVTAGVSGGLGLLAQTTTGTTSAILSSAAVRVGLANAVTQGIGVATGLQKSFNWKGVAASAVGAQVGSMIGGSLPDAGKNVFGQIANRTVTAFGAGVTTAALRGGRIDVVAVATDAFGNALGSSLASQSSSLPAWQQRMLDAQPDPVTGATRATNVSFGEEALHDARVADLRAMAGAELAGGSQTTVSSRASAPANFPTEQASPPTRSYESLIGTPQVVASGTDGQSRDWYLYDNGTLSRSVLSPTIVSTPLSGSDANVSHQSGSTEGTIRSLNPFESFMTFNPLGQMLGGMGDRIQGMVSGVANVVVHPVNTAGAIASHYGNAYQAGRLGETILGDVGSVVTGAVMSTPVGLINAAYRRDTAGGFERIGGALVDFGTAAAPLIGPSALRVGAEAFGPAVDAMTGRYAVLFGPRMGIVSDAPSAIDGSFFSGKAAAVESSNRVNAEVNALQRIAANNAVDTGSAARMARIDELATSNYNRLLAQDLSAQGYVYRGVNASMIDIYEAQGAITGRGGSPTYFSLDVGASGSEHMLGAQMPSSPQVMLRIPTSELVDPTVPRPNWGDATIGREYYTNSYPKWGYGGYRQFVGTTSSFSRDWIVNGWSD